MPLRARAFITLVVIGGCAVAVWRISAGGFDVGHPGVFAVLAAVWIVLAANPTGVPLGREVRDIDLEEPLLACAAFLLPPPGLILVMLPGGIAQNLRRSRSRVKSAFNVGMLLGTTAIGTMVIEALGSPMRHGVSARTVAAVVAGTATVALLAHVAVFAVVVLVGGAGVSSSEPTHFVLDVGTAATGTSLGVVGGVAAVDHPWVAVFVLPVVGSLAIVLRRLVEAVRDHDRLEGLLDAARSVHATIGRAEVEAATAAAAGELLESTARIQAEPAEGEQLGAPLRPTATWLVVEPRSALFPFTEDDRRILDAVAAIATTALDNAALVDHVRHQAVHDSLTGLPNWVLFEDRVRQALQSGEDVTVAAVDIDRFALVNDAFGADVGDRVLREVGARLAAALDAGDTVARRGSDEFTLLLRGRRPAEAVIRSAFASPFEVGGNQMHLSVSAGWAVTTAIAGDAVGVIRAANTALWTARRGDGDHVVEYRDDIEVSSAEWLTMESDLHRAIERGELWVAYQPQLDLASDRISGFEALVRWQHPVLGLTPPDRFLGVAERSGLIARIDLWVLDQSLRLLTAFEHEDHAGLRVAVNFSPRTLALENLVDHVRRAATGCGVSLDRLDVEVTEKVTAVDATGAVEVLASLRDLGVTISMDDFGTGYSALARLRDLPVDTIKIDQSFVRAIGTRQDEEPILLAAIEMGHRLGLRVLAEGVETAAQLAFLTAAGCDGVQGYLIARPMPAAEASRWLASWPLSWAG